MCSDLHCSVLLNSDCAHRSDRPSGICEDHIQWLVLCWQWYQRTVVISVLRDLRALLALCLRGSRDIGEDAHFIFPFAHCLLQRLHERLSHQNISFSVSLEFGKNLFVELPKFLWQGDWIVLASFQCAAIRFLKPSNREKLNFIVCTETPVEVLRFCFSAQ